MLLTTTIRRSRIAVPLLATLLQCPSVCAAAGAPEPGEAMTRARATGIVSSFHRIVTPGGVSDDLAVSIGGTRQWIKVRGRDRANPILLVIHGGPASPEMPMSWAYQSPWEDYFTVVQWDQRGSGKSYLLNDPTVVSASLSLDRIVEDAAELVRFLRTRYAKPRVFVLGHSWGSIVGLRLAQAHPEWLYAYVGMGQIVDGDANERVGYTLTLQAARRARNAQAIAELESIAPYPDANRSVSLAKIDVERKWSNFFGGLTYGRTDYHFAADMAELSPDYTDADVEAINAGSKLSLEPLLPAMTGFDVSKVTTFRTPIILFEGRHDTTTPSRLAAAWLARVKAPSKKLVWFERSAHMIEIEEPGRTLMHLVTDVRPLAHDGPRGAAASSGRR